MKELAAFTFLIVLVWVGWNQPYGAHFTSVVGDPPSVPAPSPEQTIPVATVSRQATETGVSQPTPNPDKGWMWKKTTMDAPYKSKGDK